MEMNRAAVQGVIDLVAVVHRVMSYFPEGN